MDNKNNKNEEIDLFEVLMAIVSRWKIVVMAMIIAGAIAFVFFKFAVTPKYTSSASIMVINRQSSDAITATDLTSSTTLSNDYVEIVTSRAVLEQVIADRDLDYSVKELESMISASVVTNTRMIKISVTNEDPILAKEIADSLSVITSEKICEIMKIENMVSLVDEGSLPTSPSSPATLRNTVIAALAGMIISAGLIVVIAIADDRIRTQEDVEKYLGVSVLGVIPIIEGKDEKEGGNKK